MPRAADDVQAVFDWRLQRSPSGASSWLTSFDAMLSELGRNADVYGEATEARDLGRDLKQSLFKTPKGRTYRAVFLVDGDRVFAVRVRGSGQPNLADDEL